MSDLNSSLPELVESLAQAFVLGSPDDLQHLAGVHASFKKIGEGARSAGKQLPADAAEAAAGVIEKIIFQEAADPVAALAVAMKTVSFLQETLVHHRDDDEATLPEGLGIASGAPKPEGASPAAMPEAVDLEIMAEFLSRQPGVLDEMEALTIGLDKLAPGEAPAELLRLLHTLKGEAAMLGLDDVAQNCHRVEDCMADATPIKLIDPLLEMKDWFSKRFKAQQGAEANPPSADPILAKLKAAGVRKSKPAADAPAAAASNPVAAAPSASAADTGLLGEFVSEAMEHLETAETGMLTLETEPGNEEALGGVFRAFHTIKGVAGFLGLTEIGRLAHEAENLLDGARKRTLVLEGGAMDVSFDAVDALKRMIQRQRAKLETGAEPEAEPSIEALIVRLKAAASGAPMPTEAVAAQPGKRLGEILISQGVASPDAVASAIEYQSDHPTGPKMGEVLVREGLAPARGVAQALRAQKGDAPAAQQQLMQVRETVKVDADRLDALVETIGELVIAESMVSQANELRSAASPKLIAHLKELDKITRELQAMGTGLRMIPLRATFQKMARLVRDVGHKAGKQVEFVTAGEDTELDKMVVDKIGDPLIHMIRNAVDHGLEASAEARIAAGKPAVGRVELRAFHRGGNIHIEIEDDGRGLNREAILAKARERGIVGPDAQPSDRDVFNLVFHAGLSTAVKVTDVSGRGVGMDVVKKNVEALRGRIDIQSRPGQGSVFSICLPLTLAIIDGMVLRVGSERYIVPTLSIQTTLRPEAGMLTTVFGRGRMLRLKDDLIPVFELDNLFEIDVAARDAHRRIIVVVEIDGARAGLVADELLGQQQIVIKPLGDRMQDTAGISGGAIMPDGQVSLIVDVAGILKLAHGTGSAVPLMQN